MLDEKFAASFEGHSGFVRGHHTVAGSTGVGRVSAAAPRAGFVGDPAAGLSYHPMVVSGLRIDDELPNTETFGPLVGVASVADFDEAMAWANGHGYGYGLSSSIYTTSPGVAFPLSRARLGRHGVDQQLHE
jgi:aldehyde dehydrogenase (NAD+)